MLIPKKKNPSSLGDLRLVSLCNVLMKVVTKVLANTLKTLLVKVVNTGEINF